MTTFTPLASLLGGALMGGAAVLLMAASGRIAGISGIAARLLPPYRAGSEPAGAAALLAGMIVAPLLVLAITGVPVAQAMSHDLPLLALAGLLVGFGTVWGNGCTSGHGVCGIARLSPRSLTATLVFMASAMLAVFVLRHGIGG